jgi:hypothetical protein
MQRNSEKWPNLQTMFLDQLVETDAGCFEFSGPRNSDGYGILHWKGRKIFAHRYAYETVFGKIPPGLKACHRCDHPPCCLPEHLFLGDNQANSDDMVGKRRQAFGERHGGAILSEEDVVKVKDLLRMGRHSVTQIAGMFGVSRPTISDIKSGKRWTSVQMMRRL